MNKIILSNNSKSLKFKNVHIHLILQCNFYAIHYNSIDLLNFAKNILQNWKHRYLPTMKKKQTRVKIKKNLNRFRIL